MIGFLIFLQLALVLMTIGLGTWGMCVGFAFGCMLVNWSWLAAIWREVRGACASFARARAPHHARAAARRTNT